MSEMLEVLQREPAVKFRAVARATSAITGMSMPAANAAPIRQTGACAAPDVARNSGMTLALESLPGMAHSVDRSGRLLAVSDPWLAKMGHARDDVIGRLEREFMMPASAVHSVSAVLPALFASGRAEDVEYQMVTRRGDILDVLMSAVVERASDGLPQRTITVMTDITALRRAERALRDQKQHLACIIEGTQAGTWECDLSTGETLVNQVYAAMLGYAPGDQPVRTRREFIERVHPDDQPKFAAFWAPGPDGWSVAHEVEFRMRHRDGHWVWVLSRGSVVASDVHGRALTATGIQLDITDRKAAQLAAKASRRDLRNVIDALPSMIGCWDRQLINRFANRAYTDWFGADALTLPGTHISELLGDELYRRNLPFLEAALRGEEQVFERSIPCPDGRGVRHSLVRYLPYRIDGEVQGLYVLVSDVTPLKETQALLETRNAELEQRTRQAEAASLAKSEFLAAMSHDLRSPLTSIRGFAELMEQMLETPQFREMAGYIVKGSLHLNGLLTDILDMAKVEAGAMPLNCQDHDLREFVQATANFFSLTAANKGLALTLRLARDLPPSLNCDSLRLRQILNNLLSNALKFTQAGGVVIEVERVDEGIAIHVDDSGPGIPEPLRERVFQKFRQANAQISQDHGGTGLGLALSRRLAELMRGRLTVGSSTAGGSRFTLTLPTCAMAG